MLFKLYLHNNQTHILTTDLKQTGLCWKIIFIVLIINNQPNILLITFGNKHNSRERDRVKLSLVGSISTTSQIFPTVYDTIGQNWKVVFMKGYLVSTINHILLKKPGTKNSKVKWLDRSISCSISINTQPQHKYFQLIMKQ